MSKCPFCQSSEFGGSYMPSTIFNKKRFNYRTCNKCKLIYLDSFPNEDDLGLMYPTTYQNGVNRKINMGKPLGLRFRYDYQLDVIKKHSKEKRILDYGCGDCNFLINFQNEGYQCLGTEYNAKHVDILKQELPEMKFFTIDEFNKSKEVYSIIRISNVLEHLTNPTEVINNIVNSKMKQGGLLLIEGPIENNSNLALFFRKTYFVLKKYSNPSWTVTHTPTHIFMSDRKNQRQFFNKFNLEEVHFEIIENAWPFPETFNQFEGIGSKLKWIIAKLSIFISRLFKNKLGNTFMYAGVKK